MISSCSDGLLLNRYCSCKRFEDVIEQKVYIRRCHILSLTSNCLLIVHRSLSLSLSLLSFLYIIVNNCTQHCHYCYNWFCISTLLNRINHKIFFELLKCWNHISCCSNSSSSPAAGPAAAARPQPPPPPPRSAAAVGLVVVRACVGVRACVYARVYSSVSPSVRELLIENVYK